MSPCKNHTAISRTVCAEYAWLIYRESGQTVQNYEVLVSLVRPCLAVDYIVLRKNSIFRIQLGEHEFCENSWYVHAPRVLFEALMLS